ncbi:Ff.00g090410.m01.CDS01 [Fusarium sp. VM40]|nr:Ff.00g090410.m01.CDS01 [Fusarium sp. VM40]
MADSHEFRRRILLLVTTGGFTHAAPVLEIGAVLASRGHDIQFATCEGQEDWTADYPFIKTVYTVGPAAAEHDLDLHYESMRLWRHEHGFAPMMKSKYFFDNFWTDTYKSLRALCEDEATRPDFIVADFFADSAARDMLKQFNIQLASIWPQMPYAMAPVSYHPGQPGFQADGALTSEHASLTSRFWNEFVVMAALPTVIPWLLWTKRMRADAGVDYSHSLLPKPDYLVLVNSFWGLEAPKELPPLMAPVGPVLSDEYPHLDEDLAQFLDSHEKTIYVSLGTHVSLPGEELAKFLLGFIKALDAGFINGVIWAMPSKARANFDTSKSYIFTDGSILSVSNLLNDAYPDFRLPVFAPQRAILAHRNTVLFLTHGGGSSANETLFHGTPVLVVGYFFDQLCNSARLAASGVGTSLDKSHVTPSSISSAIANITTDTDGLYATNVRRMQRIATLNAKRKYLAADLIEEVMTDQELRFRKGVELRPMHLQTADMRMSIWKARNWDMWLVSLTGLAAGGFASWWFATGGWRKLLLILARSVRMGRGFAREILYSRRS